MTNTIDVRRRSIFLRIGSDHVVNAEEIALVANGPGVSTTISFRDGAPPVTIAMAFASVVAILADWECLR